MKSITAKEFKVLSGSGQEYALIDVRERGLYGMGHLLLSTHLPYSSLELRVQTLVPRKDTRLIVADAGTGVAERAIGALERLGYTDLSILEGTGDDWRSAGFEVFVGDDPLPKAFGEVVESHRHTPSVAPAELRAMMEEGRKFVLLDGRSEEEFVTHCVPGAISVPNGELLWRVGDLVPDRETTIVVSCAGRTRSIVGAQTLIDAGVGNPVFALRGGTQAWRMAGYELASGVDPTLKPVSQTAAARSLEFAERLRSRVSVPSMSGEDLETARARRRTVYIIDIRTRAEFEAGHAEGAIHVPGGQLVQTVTRWCATKNAIISLVEEAPYVRATTTAYWLRLMGWDARVLDTEAIGTAIGPATAARGQEAPRLSVAQLRADLAAGAVLIDAGPGMEYRERHLPGAIWLIRPNVDKQVELLARSPKITVYADIDGRADLVAQEISRLVPDAQVTVFAGGKRAWTEAGGTFSSSPEQPSDADCIDYLFWTHDRLRGNDEASAEYFRWELALPGQIERDGSVNFQIS
ncbi:rhodanese-like domain-containing protein [Ensifer adhaerens]|uniref:Rhodanese-like domain-containing protein n=1 Tax=Ensifer adhaerens TaxID=106592 RepID=A0A9Q9DEG9_ENSAD|nr:rhodanese-like domain-containing protein [Ensifer adhaerens]USJ28405.1 rhodanese-like domain-containing protein [Ensifer adhaerens]